jgi:hypothetical protein
LCSEAQAFWDIASELGAFLIYCAVLLFIFYWKFFHVPQTAAAEV